MASLPGLTALGTGSASSPAGPGDAVALEGAALEGAALYALNCSVCHGPTGGGLAEARLVFPPDERNCSRCHKANNPVVQPLTRPFVDNDMFPVGDPPALVAPDHAAMGSNQAAPLPLAAAAAPEALYAYLRATMPRYDPGRQTDEEYWLLTAHLLRMNGRQDAAADATSRAASAGLSPGGAGD